MLGLKLNHVSKRGHSRLLVSSPYNQALYDKKPMAVCSARHKLWKKITE